MTNSARPVTCGRPVRLTVALLLALGMSITAQAQPTGNRVVVFEGFYRPG
jgi:hypothetical protein